MVRQSRRKRRSFGSGPEEKVKDGRRYLYYSFVTPVWAFSKWPELELGPRQWHCVTPGNEYEGEAWLSDAKKALIAGTWEPDKLKRKRERREGVTFRQYATDWVEHRKRSDGTDLKETSKQKYRESLELYLLPYFGDMPLSSITPKDVQSWFDSFTPDRMDADRDNRRAHVYAHLKTIMRSAAMDPIDNEGNTLIPSPRAASRPASPRPCTSR